MELRNLEDQVLHLPREERAQLVKRLVLSLDVPSEEELRSDWLAEARRRADELDDGSVEAVPFEDVLGKARKLVR